MKEFDRFSFPRNYSGKVPLFFRKFPEKFRRKFPEICELTTLVIALSLLQLSATWRDELALTGENVSPWAEPSETRHTLRGLPNPIWSLPIKRFEQEVHPKLVPASGLQRSLKVTGAGTVRWGTYDCPLVIHDNCGSDGAPGCSRTVSEVSAILIEKRKFLYSTCI